VSPLIMLSFFTKVVCNAFQLTPCRSSYIQVQHNPSSICSIFRVKSSSCGSPTSCCIIFYLPRQGSCTSELTLCGHARRTHLTSVRVGSSTTLAIPRANTWPESEARTSFSLLGWPDGVRHNPPTSSEQGKGKLGFKFSLAYDRSNVIDEGSMRPCSRFPHHHQYYCILHSKNDNIHSLTRMHSRAKFFLCHRAANTSRTRIRTCNPKVGNRFLVCPPQPLGYSVLYTGIAGKTHGHE